MTHPCFFRHFHLALLAPLAVSFVFSDSAIFLGMPNQADHHVLFTICFTEVQ